MNILVIAGAIAATFSAIVLGLIQIISYAKWKKTPDLIPTLTYLVIATILWTGAVLL